MPFELPASHKFGCLCLVYAGVDRTLAGAEPLALGNDLWAIFGPPFQIDDHWRHWLGSVKTESLMHTSLALLAHRHSDQPNILDNENDFLVKAAASMFYGLLMSEVFHHDKGLFLSGANHSGVIGIRQVSDLEQHIRPNRVNVRSISRITLQKAATIASAIAAIHSGPGQYERLRRGFRAWLRGVQQYWGEDRLHQFVRAVEAVVKPEIGRSEALFVHRCQIFVGTSDALRELCRELYQLRSHAEHMNPLESVLANYAPADRERIGLIRAFQSQILASTVYDRILTTPNLRAIFDSDAHIEDFWTRPMHEQQATWGDPIDLQALATARLE